MIHRFVLPEARTARDAAAWLLACLAGRTFACDNCFTGSVLPEARALGQVAAGQASTCLAGGKLMGADPLAR